MTLNKLFKRNVDEYRVKRILKQFVKSCSNTKIVIYFEITGRGVVKLYTNRPGILIGRGGKDINAIKESLKKECNAKDVKLYEMRTIVSNCGVC